MEPRLLLTVVRLGWFALPVVAGGTMAEGITGIDNRLGATIAVLAWTGWGLGLAALALPSTVSLTVVRMLAPLPLAATVWAGAQPGVGVPLAAASAALAAAVAAVAFTPHLGAAMADGSSYGDEQRWPLRPPTALLAGPVEIAWLVAVAGVVGPAFLYASVGPLAALGAGIVGLPLAGISARRLHALSRRWLVLVPAGLVIVDHLALRDPVLLPRRSLRSIGPATLDTSATDLTAGAAGLVLEIRVREPQAVALAKGRTGAEMRDLDTLLVTPSLPGGFLRAAAARGLPTDHHG